MEVVDFVGFLVKIVKFEVFENEVYGLEFHHDFGDFVLSAVSGVGLSDRRVERLGVKVVALGAGFRVQILTAVPVRGCFGDEIAKRASAHSVRELRELTPQKVAGVRADDVQKAALSLRVSEAVLERFNRRRRKFHSEIISAASEGYTS